MPVVLVRIDDRLVHGQVVEAWIPFLKADRVAVVCDAAAADSTQLALMRLALPEHVELDVLPSVEAAAYAAQAQAGACKVLMLVPGPKEVLAMVEGGARLESVNVGGLHYAAGRVMLGRVIYLSEEDRRALEALSACGVSLEGRAVPSDAKTDIAELLKTAAA